jgi:tetratricopeptide (TPR) repeat protein
LSVWEKLLRGGGILLLLLVVAGIVAVVLRFVKPERALIIVPFEVSQGTTSFNTNGKAVADLVSDDISLITKAADNTTPFIHGLIEPVNLRLYLEPTIVGIEVKGLSFNSIAQEWLRWRETQSFVTGDVFISGGSLQTRARISSGRNSMESGTLPTTEEGLKAACSEIAEKIMAESEPGILSAYYFGQGKVQEAVKLALRWANQEPKEPRAHKLAGFLALGANQITVAQAESDAVIALEPKNPAGYGVSGYINLSRGDCPSSIGRFKFALQLKPVDYSNLTGLALAYACNKQFSLAVATMNEITNRGFENASVDQTLAMFYIQMGKFAEAAHTYATALDKFPRDVDLNNLINACNMLIKGGDYNDSLAISENALVVHSDNVGLLLLSGKSNFELGHYEEAAKKFRRATELSPQLIVGWQMLGTALGYSALPRGGPGYMDAQKLREAIDSFQNGIKNYQSQREKADAAQRKILDEIGEVMFRQLGMVYLFAKDTEKAAESLNRALNLDSNDGYAYEYLGDTYATEKKCHLAEKNFGKAAQLLSGQQGEPELIKSNLDRLSQHCPNIRH